MATIYWRGKWAWARATIKGVEHRHPLETTSKREAQERFQLWFAKLTLDTSKWSKAETSFEDAVRKFTDDHLPTLKTRTQERYLGSLMILEPYFGRKTLQGISKSDLMEFVSARRRQGISSSTIRRDLSTLSVVFTVCSDYELCDANPVLPFLRQMKRRGSLKEAPSKTRYLSHAEELAILTEARRRFDKARLKVVKAGGKLNNHAITKLMIMAAIAVDIDTGLRDEELLRLRWCQVDLDGNQIQLFANDTKNKRSRLVPLLPRAKAILSALPRHKKSDLVFWHRTGHRFSELTHALQDLAAAVGIVDYEATAARERKRIAEGRKPPKDPRMRRPVTGVSFHDLRRTCGCRLLQDHKLPIEQVSLWLGHSTTAITQKAYAFLEAEQLQESVGNVRTNVGTIDTKEALNTIVNVGNFAS